MITYQQQLDLVNKGLSTMKVSGNLTTFKYHRKVMYDYLWKTNSDLLECRGHTYDNITGQIVQLPPKKTFNYLEDNYWKDVPLDTMCIGFKKYNGYMAAATMHNQQLVVSTTGTTTSDYAKYAFTLISAPHIKGLIEQYPERTFLFEIVAEWDKHIVEEVNDCYLLGSRNKQNGNWFPVGDSVVITLREFLDLAKVNKSEGWMIYPETPFGFFDFNNCCKIKTDYYIGKKKLMRMTSKDVSALYNSSCSVENRLPEQWKFAAKQIKKDFTEQEKWDTMKPLTRREYLEKIYKEKYLE